MSYNNFYGRGEYARKYNLQPADRLIEPIFQTGISKHHSIYLGMGQYGTEWIAENQKFAGVRIVKAADFLRPDKKYRKDAFQGTHLERVAAIKRALNVVGQPYHLILQNCEHYASYVQTGKAQSIQVQGFAALAALICLGLFLTK
jgi:hypothetical protein